MLLAFYVAVGRAFVALLIGAAVVSSSCFIGQAVYGLEKKQNETLSRAIAQQMNPGGVPADPPPKKAEDLPLWPVWCVLFVVYWGLSYAMIWHGESDGGSFLKTVHWMRWAFPDAPPE